MESLDTIFELCKEAGVHEQAVIPVEKIKFSDEVRHLCEVNYCGSYGKTWACPPGVGSVEECREKCMAFTQVYIFTTWHPLEDSLDLDGMQEGKAAHEEVCARVRKIFEENFAETLVLTSEGCGNCQTCTYPDAPWRFPDHMCPSVESYGIFVNEEAAEAGIHYINGANTVTYFGNVFF